MSVLVVSLDDEARSALSRALERAGVPGRYTDDVDEARAMTRDDPPHVLVVDGAISSAVALVEELHSAAPWARAFIVQGLAAQNPSQATHALLIPKPFDAAELAATLAREDRVALVTRQRMLADVRIEELSQIVDASLEAMIGVALDGTIQAWNASAAKIYGYRESAAIGRPLEALLGETDFTARGPREVTRKQGDGTELIVVVSVSPVFDAVGGLRGFAELSLDVTEMRRLQRRLEHEDRLATLGRLAATLAHEINNGLTVIDFALVYGQQRADELGDQPLAEAMSEAHMSARATAAFVKQVCGFGRKDAAELVTAPIDSTVKLATRLVRARAMDRDITVETQESGLSVAHDPIRLAQALVNLLSNAIDAAIQKVVVQVRTGRERVEIVIGDDGPGIDPAIADKLFESFFTTKPLGEGTGIGLAVVRQVVDAHHGTIALVPNPSGVGTAAVLSLPYATA